MKGRIYRRWKVKKRVKNKLKISLKNLIKVNQELKYLNHLDLLLKRKPLMNQFNQQEIFQEVVWN